MTDDELLALNKIGFIPGPDEEEVPFLARVEAAKKKFREGAWIPEAHWDWVRESLGRMFDVKPLYICAFYSNRSLAPWQGAASWIEGRALSEIQLRQGLKKGSYLGLYEREEILAHEAVHAARSGFNESRSEEFFAYMTSSKKWRQVLGPILQRPWEVWPLLVALVGGMIWPTCYLAAALWLGVGFYRLIAQHRRLKKAADQILQSVGDPSKVRAILFRLTDEEIERFSKGEKIEKYAQSRQDLRWRLIRMYLYGKESGGSSARMGKARESIQIL